MVLKLQQEFYRKTQESHFRATSPLSLLLFSYIKISLYTSCSVITFGNGKYFLSMLLLSTATFWVFLTQQGYDRRKGIAESSISRLAEQEQMLW